MGAVYDAMIGNFWAPKGEKSALMGLAPPPPPKNLEILEN
jgi:hypothetical protein